VKEHYDETLRGSWSLKKLEEKGLTATYHFGIVAMVFGRLYRQQV